MEEQKIREICNRMRTIRSFVEQDSKEVKYYFKEFYELITSLRILDPDNPELDIGIHGKPYGGI